MVRGFALGIVLGAGVVIGTLCLKAQSPAYGQRNETLGNGLRGALLVTHTGGAAGNEHVVVVDTVNRVMAAYHVHGETGQISLKSVRRFRWDLMMDEFNGQEPTPQDIRALIERR